MKIVIASGKGGVGKSMLASSLCMLLAQKNKIVAIDADVDAPNLHLWLGEGENWDQTKEISVLEKAVIDKPKCNLCGKCVEICAFGAIEMVSGKPKVNEFFCEGCGACEVVCPQKAISLKKVKNAQIRVKNNVFGFSLVSAQLYPGETGSGKIVDQLKVEAAKFDREIMILDSPAGIGCPVIAALNGSDLAVLITEPTPSGLTDLKRVLKVVNHFKIPWRVVVNKWDINRPKTKKIIKWANNNFLGKISYDQKIFQAIANLEPILTTDLPAKAEILKIYRQLVELIK